jgi:hypothetical protein
LIHFKIYESINKLPKSWDALVLHDIFLQTSYLRVLDDASPKTISIYYIGVFNADKLVGVCIAQRVQVYAKDVFRSYKSSILKQVLKTGISKILRGNVLVIGNITHTGQHGFYFNAEQISQADYLDAIFKAVHDLKAIIKQQNNKRIRVIMFKDFFVDDTINQYQNLFTKNQLHKVFVQPNMILPLKTEWKTKEDYISALNKKYKRRYKTARKKSIDISCEELNFELLKQLENRIHKLYLYVSNNAKFNTFLLPKNHFLSLKQNLQEKFKVFGYFLDNELIGFYSLIINNKTLETYFLGYDSKHQYANQLYLNMLYNMLEFGIDNNMESVVYARTAMEIKSSVGAEKRDMIMYMKHTNSFLNFIFKQIFNMMNPNQKWTERHPFKEY